MNEREREIEARVNAATGGEVWTVERYKSASVVIANGKYPVADVHRKHVSTAEFITNAPADIRYLLARVRELETALQQIADHRYLTFADVPYTDAIDALQEAVTNYKRVASDALATAAASGDAETEAT